MRLIPCLAFCEWVSLFAKNDDNVILIADVT